MARQSGMSGWHDAFIVHVDCLHCFMASGITSTSYPLKCRMFIAPIANHQLRSMLPHAGQMCLLEQVARWHETEIECIALSHLDLTNPLRFDSKLPAHAGIEYCAQAIAIHGYLTSGGGQGSPKRGYLAVVLGTHWNIDRLDRCIGPLQVIATKQVTLQQGVSYAFAIKHQGHDLLTGQAIVALE